MHTLGGLQGNRVDKDSRERGKVVSLWLEQYYAVPMMPALPAKKMSNINETNNINRNDAAQGRNDWDGQSGGNSTAKEIGLSSPCCDICQEVVMKGSRGQFIYFLSLDNLIEGNHPFEVGAQGALQFTLGDAKSTVVRRQFEIRGVNEKEIMCKFIGEYFFQKDLGFYLQS